MKKFVLFVLVGLGVWQLYQDRNQPDLSFFTVKDSFSSPAPVQNTSRFRCDGREHCSQMTSRAEAEYFTSNCPNTKMDGDNDGDPCENDSRF